MNKWIAWALVSFVLLGCSAKDASAPPDNSLGGFVGGGAPNAGFGGYVQGGGNSPGGYGNYGNVPGGGGNSPGGYGGYGNVPGGGGTGPGGGGSSPGGSGNVPGGGGLQNAGGSIGTGGAPPQVDPIGNANRAPGFVNLAPPMGQPLPDQGTALSPAAPDNWQWHPIDGAICRDGSPMATE